MYLRSLKMCGGMLCLVMFVCFMKATLNVLKPFCLFYSMSCLSWNSHFQPFFRGMYKDIQVVNVYQSVLYLHNISIFVNVNCLQVANLNRVSIATGYLETGFGWNQWLVQVSPIPSDGYNISNLICAEIFDCTLFRSALFSQLPGSFLFIGNIYAGSKALSLLVSVTS